MLWVSGVSAEPVDGVDGINDEVDAGSNCSKTLLLCNEVLWSVEECN